MYILENILNYISASFAENLEVILRLSLAAFIGALIGVERESKNLPAGLRTHTLVTLGSTLIMLVSIYGFKGLGESSSGGEPARLAAQVVSGIGFLGAGTILRNGNSIRGLTTAASIWVCGGIGLAIGTGYYFGAIVTTLLVIVTLKSMGVLERRIFKQQYRTLIVECSESIGVIGSIESILISHYISVRDISVIDMEEDTDSIQGDDEKEELGYESGGSNRRSIKFRVKLPSRVIQEGFFDEIMMLDSVRLVYWEEE